MLALLSCALLLAAPSLNPAPAPEGPGRPQLQLPMDAAARIIGGALTDGVAYARLAELTDTIGPRLTGSAGAEAAIAWAKRRFEEDGIAVHLEKVRVPHWVRGVERAEVIASASAAPLSLAITALGGSVSTPPEGITAELLEVHSLAEWPALAARAKGRIVLWQHTMSSASGYSEFAHLRTRGAAEAVKAGAVASLVRSLATTSLRSPHTGAMNYDEGGARIPGAALATEDAELLHRLAQRGPVSIHLTLGCQNLPDVDSFNVVAEVRGRELPAEIVLLGAHLDSWDLAQGAVDDGAGVAIVMEALRQLAVLHPAPRRTVRAVLFINEENGLKGGEGYAAAHAAEQAHHVAALEADSGAGRPLNLELHSGAGGAELLRPWTPPLETLGTDQVVEGDAGGADISPLGKVAPAVPMLSVRQDASHYFDLHHSAADTLDKVKPHDLAATAAAVAWTAYALAEMKGTLPRPAVTPARVPVPFGTPALTK